MALISHRTRSILSLSTTLYIIGLVLGSRSLRTTLTSIFTPKAHPYRFFALLTTLLLNFKSLPLVWHIRLFGPMYYQLFLQPRPLPPDALFRPMITKGSRTSLAETDYNLHKSNSTYFADLDIGRTMLISCLLRKGIRQSSKYQNASPEEVAGASGVAGDGAAGKRRRSSIPAAIRSAATSASEVATAETTLRTPHSDLTSPTQPQPPTENTSPNPNSHNSHNSQPVTQSAAKKTDRFLVALGGVSCHFKRELKPNEEFEVWTRVLAWDRKWIYLVSHMVKAGAVVPDEYALGASRSWSERVFGGRRGRGGKGGKMGKGAKGGYGEGMMNGGMNGALKDLEREKKAEWQGAIFASSISKYVVKKGRLTIPPELVWQRSDLLPTDSTVQGAVQDVGAQTAGKESVAGAEEGVTLSSGQGVPLSSPDSNPRSKEDPYAWTSANVERERQRGMELAGNFAALDGLIGEFPTSWGFDEREEEDEREVKVLGSFQDWLVF